MEYENAKDWCHVRSSIYRRAKPEIKYAKNHSAPFDDRVPIADQQSDDWEEWDPNDYYNISLGAESY